MYYASNNDNVKGRFISIQLVPKLSTHNFLHPCNQKFTQIKTPKMFLFENFIVLIYVNFWLQGWRKLWVQSFGTNWIEIKLPLMMYRFPNGGKKNIASGTRFDTFDGPYSMLCMYHLIRFISIQHTLALHCHLSGACGWSQFYGYPNWCWEYRLLVCLCWSVFQYLKQFMLDNILSIFILAKLNLTQKGLRIGSICQF